MSIRKIIIKIFKDIEEYTTSKPYRRELLEVLHLRITTKINKYYLFTSILDYVTSE